MPSSAPDTEWLIVSTEKDSSPHAPSEAHSRDQRRVLAWVLTINLMQSAGGLAVGLAASSTALIGAALDNLADASVYAVSLYAIGRSSIAKARVAKISGWLLIVFAAMLLLEVARRFFYGAEPIGSAMMIMATINLALNIVCLRLLSRHKADNVNFRASAIFTNNDSLANLGILLSGLLINWLGTAIPDLLIGLVVAYIALQGGREILAQAREAATQPSSPRP